MGGCSTKLPIPKPTKLLKKVIPTCCYFSRDQKNLYCISSYRVNKYTFNGKLKVYKDSGVGLTSNGSILLIGGTNSSGLLTNRFYIIDPNELSAFELPPSPKGIKEGFLFEYKEYYYYFGGVCESESISSTQPQEGSSILRYSILDNEWEIFDHKNSEKSSLQTILSRKISEKKEFDLTPSQKTNLTIKDLISPGVFLHENRVYLVGGKILKNKVFKPTRKIFSIGLDNETFDFVEEKIVLPVKLISPICSIENSNTVIVTGGTLEGGLNNSEIFVVNVSKSSVSSLASQFYTSIIENYPLTCNQNETIFFSYPKIFVKPKFEDRVYSYLFQRADKIGEGYLSGEITIKSNLKSNPVIIKSIDLSLSGKPNAENEIECFEKIETFSSSSSDKILEDLITLNTKRKIDKSLCFSPSIIKGNIDSEDISIIRSNESYRCSNLCKKKDKKVKNGDLEYEERSSNESLNLEGR